MTWNTASLNFDFDPFGQHLKFWTLTLRSCRQRNSAPDATSHQNATKPTLPASVKTPLESIKFRYRLASIVCYTYVDNASVGGRDGDVAGYP